MLAQADFCPLLFFLAVGVCVKRNSFPHYRMFRYLLSRVCFRLIRHEMYSLIYEAVEMEPTWSIEFLNFCLFIYAILRESYISKHTR